MLKSWSPFLLLLYDTLITWKIKHPLNHFSQRRLFLFCFESSSSVDNGKPFSSGVSQGVFQNIYINDFFSDCPKGNIGKILVARTCGGITCGGII